MSRIGNVLAGLAILYTAGTFFVIDHTAFFVNLGIGAVLGALYIFGRGVVRDYRTWRSVLDEMLAIEVERNPDLIVELHGTYRKQPVYIFAYDDEAAFRFAIERRADWGQEWD